MIVRLVHIVIDEDIYSRPHFIIIVVCIAVDGIA